MSLTRRDALRLTAVTPLASLLQRSSAAAGQPQPDALTRVRLAVSTYSYWHFRIGEIPVQRVIEDAARLGFDGVEILHRQMDGRVAGLPQQAEAAAFRNGLALPMLSIHQDFVYARRRGAAEGHRAHRALHRARGTARHSRRAAQFRALEDDQVVRRPHEGERQRAAAARLHATTTRSSGASRASGHACPPPRRHGVMLALENHWGLTTDIENLLRIYKRGRIALARHQPRHRQLPWRPVRGDRAARAARLHRAGEDLLRRRRVVHARPRLSANRHASCGRRASAAGCRWRWKARSRRRPPFPRALRCCARPSPRKGRADQDGHQPTGWPRFCSSSHVFSGAK